MSEQINAIPINLKDDLDEALLYAYFAIIYYNEQIFKIINTRTDKFSSNFEYNSLLGKENSYSILTSEDTYKRFSLN